VYTGTKASLVLDAMGQADATLDEAEVRAGEVATMLTEGKGVEAVSALGECLKVWQLIHTGIGQSLQILEIEPDSITIRDMPLIEALSRPREVLLQIKQALLAQDFVLLADILQYEFADVTALWHGIIARIEQEARDRL